MATNEELFSLMNDSALRNNVTVACVKAAEAIMLEDGGTLNHTNRLVWSASVFGNPKSEAARMFMAILAANSALTVEQIQGASDEAIQANVDDHVDLFAVGV